MDPEITGDSRISLGLFSIGGLRVEFSLLAEGDFALLAESINQCLIEASWLIKGCLDERCPGRPLDNPFGGAKRSEFLAITWSVLPLDRLLSFGGGCGRC